MPESGARPGLPRLMAISDRHAAPQGLAGWVRALADAGVDAIQVREKDLDDRALFDRVREVRASAPRLSILVNGRLDIALAAGAQGVHLPGDGVPPRVLRHRFGPGVLIGCSTHSLEEIAAARDGGADYVTFGPIADTPSKRAFGPAQGLEALRRAAELGLPVLALGGVGPDRFPAIAAVGAAGAAGIRAYRTADGARRAVRAAEDTWPRGPGIDTLAWLGPASDRRHGVV